MPSLALLIRMGPWLAILALLGVVAVQNSRVHAWHQRADLCAEGRKADRAAYQAAQAEAARQNLEQVQQTEAKQKAANDEVTRNLNARLERLRSELRRQAGADQGHPDAAGSPEADRESGTPEATGLCLTPSEHVRAAENEERHDQLITLVERLMLEINGEPK